MRNCAARLCNRARLQSCRKTARKEMGFSPCHVATRTKLLSRKHPQPVADLLRHDQDKHEPQTPSIRSQCEPTDRRPSLPCRRTAFQSLGLCHHAGSLPRPHHRARCNDNRKGYAIDQRKILAPPQGGNRICRRSLAKRLLRNPSHEQRDIEEVSGIHRGKSCKGQPGELRRRISVLLCFVSAKESRQPRRSRG